MTFSTFGRVSLAALCICGCASGASMSPEATLAEWANALVLSEVENAMAFYEDSEHVIAMESTGKVHEGLQAIREMYEAAFDELVIEKASLDILDVSEHGDVAWAAVRLRIDSVRLADRSRWILEVRGSLVLRRAGDSWRIALEHFSPIEGVPRWRPGSG